MNIPKAVNLSTFQEVVKMLVRDVMKIKKILNFVYTKLISDVLVSLKFTF